MTITATVASSTIAFIIAAVTLVMLLRLRRTGRMQVVVHEMAL